MTIKIPPDIVHYSLTQPFGFKHKFISTSTGNCHYNSLFFTTSKYFYLKYKLTWSSANLRRAAVGSLPGDKIKMSGVHELLSLKEPAKSNGGGSMNLRPSLAVTKSCTAGTIWKIQQDFEIRDLKTFSVRYCVNMKWSSPNFGDYYSKFCILFYGNVIQIFAHNIENIRPCLTQNSQIYFVDKPSCSGCHHVWINTKLRLHILLYFVPWTEQQ